MVQKLSLKDWKQEPSGEESIYILIAEKKAIFTKTSELISHSKKEVALIADKQESCRFWLSFQMNTYWR